MSERLHSAEVGGNEGTQVLIGRGGRAANCFAWSTRRNARDKAPNVLDPPARSILVKSRAHQLRWKRVGRPEAYKSFITVPPIQPTRRRVVWAMYQPPDNEVTVNATSRPIENPWLSATSRRRHTLGNPRVELSFIFNKFLRHRANDSDNFLQATDAMYRTMHIDASVRGPEPVDAIDDTDLFSEEQVAIEELPQEFGLFNDDEEPADYDPCCTWEVFEEDMIRYDPTDRGFGSP
ncbi:hypothetical protein MKZ38_007200 [Zalerion maritima]|uniref:Uncharacterized protein n=1 Tax=Zalerion maritima TaxID=339359 RepID=A0AAD5WN25_9PEZI|nr:hypothetical protein MKZ38_007200 [Zalerion maritima]